MALNNTQWLYNKIPFIKINPKKKKLTWKKGTELNQIELLHRNWCYPNKYIIPSPQ